LHVDRANARGRIHGNFESLEKQREWLARWETWCCGTAARYLGVQQTANLVALRAGEVVQEREVDEPRIEEIAAREAGVSLRADEVQS
jgi:hypothetical protein